MHPTMVMGLRPPLGKSLAYRRPPPPRKPAPPRRDHTNFLSRGARPPQASASCPAAPVLTSCPAAPVPASCPAAPVRGRLRGDSAPTSRVFGLAAPDSSRISATEASRPAQGKGMNLDIHGV